VKALQQVGFRTRAVNVREDLSKLERLLRRNPPDVIFNLVEHFHDDAELEPNVAALFEMHRVPYTGAPPFALALCHKKGLAKQVLLANGVPTPRFRLLEEPRIPKRHGLHYPLIVKPSRSDASIGVERGSVIYDYDQLANWLPKVFEDFDPPILVEEFIEGRELHISILGNDPPEMLPPIEFDFSRLPDDHPDIISYDAKWNPLQEVYHQVHTVCPAELSKRAQEKVHDAALRAYRITGCRDYARLDIRLAKHSHPFVLEVNPNPDLTEGVSYMESAEAAGLTFGETLRRIVQFAAARKPEPPELHPRPQEPEIKLPEVPHPPAPETGDGEEKLRSRLSRSRVRGQRSER
jgi:D-alanine-D-alanine ligase